MKKLYVTLKNGTVSGAVSEQEAANLVRNGLAAIDAYARPADSEQWKPLGALISVSRPPAVTAPPPASAKSAKKNPNVFIISVFLMPCVILGALHVLTGAAL